MFQYTFNSKHYYCYNDIKSEYPDLACDTPYVFIAQYNVQPGSCMYAYNKAGRWIHSRQAGTLFVRKRYICDKLLKTMNAQLVREKHSRDLLEKDAQVTAEKHLRELLQKDMIIQAAQHDNQMLKKQLDIANPTKI